MMCWRTNSRHFKNCLSSLARTAQRSTWQGSRRGERGPRRAPVPTTGPNHRHEPRQPESPGGAPSDPSKRSRGAVVPEFGLRHPAHRNAATGRDQTESNRHRGHPGARRSSARGRGSTGHSCRATQRRCSARFGRGHSSSPIGSGGQIARHQRRDQRRWTPSTKSSELAGKGAWHESNQCPAWPDGFAEQHRQLTVGVSRTSSSAPSRSAGKQSSSDEDCGRDRNEFEERARPLPRSTSQGWRTATTANRANRSVLQDSARGPPSVPAMPSPERRRGLLPARDGSCWWWRSWWRSWLRVCGTV